MKHIKYVFNEDEEYGMLEDTRSHAIKYLSYVKSSFDKFQVGDSLILKQCSFDEDKNIFEETECKYENIPITIRYIVVKEVVDPQDSSNRMMFVKRLNESGQFDENSDVRPLLCYEHDIGWGYFNKFEIDPLQVDSVLIGQEFNVEDVFSDFIRHKEDVVNLRKSRAKVFTELKALNAFLESVDKSGSLLYFHEDKDEEYRVERVHPLSTKSFFVHQTYKSFIKTQSGLIALERARSRGLNTQFKPNEKIIKMPGVRNLKWTTSLDLLNCALYTEKPDSFHDEN